MVRCVATHSLAPASASVFEGRPLTAQCSRPSTRRMALSSARSLRGARMHDGAKFYQNAPRSTVVRVRDACTSVLLPWVVPTRERGGSPRGEPFCAQRTFHAKRDAISNAGHVWGPRTRTERCPHVCRAVRALGGLVEGASDARTSVAPYVPLAGPPRLFGRFLGQGLTTEYRRIARLYFADKFAPHRLAFARAIDCHFSRYRTNGPRHRSNASAADNVLEMWQWGCTAYGALIHGKRCNALAVHGGTALAFRAFHFALGFLIEQMLLRESVRALRQIALIDGQQVSNALSKFGRWRSSPCNTRLSRTLACPFRFTFARFGARFPDHGGQTVATVKPARMAQCAVLPNVPIGLRRAYSSSM
jgi:hypothetical protein